MILMALKCIYALFWVNTLNSVKNTDMAQLYELMPVKHCKQNVKHVSLKRSLENSSIQRPVRSAPLF